MTERRMTRERFDAIRRQLVAIETALGEHVAAGHACEWTNARTDGFKNLEAMEVAIRHFLNGELHEYLGDVSHETAARLWAESITQN